MTIPKGFCLAIDPRNDEADEAEKDEKDEAPCTRAVSTRLASDACLNLL